MISVSVDIATIACHVASSRVRTLEILGPVLRFLLHRSPRSIRTKPPNQPFPVQKEAMHARIVKSGSELTQLSLARASNVAFATLRSLRVMIRRKASLKPFAWVDALHPLCRHHDLIQRHLPVKALFSVTNRADKRRDLVMAAGKLRRRISGRTGLLLKEAHFGTSITSVRRAAIYPWLFSMALPVALFRFRV